jgi:hypothetical protein
VGFVLCMSPCVVCRQAFTYHPHRVPSVTIHGEREPICASCIEAVNVRRAANGLPPIVPLPGAYDSMAEGEW